MSQRQISVIIPTYNEADTLPYLLKEIEQRSSGYLLEIIVADGGSTDETLAFLSGVDVRVVECSKRGRASQMNEGAANAKGSVLYFLHADTIPPFEFDRKICNVVNSGTTSGCFRLSFDDKHPLLRLYSWFTRFSWTLIRFGDQSLFAVTQLFWDVGGFDDSLAIMEDQEIVRALSKNSQFTVLRDHVTTSARKYRDNGIIRLQFIFTVIVLLYYAGAGQVLLKDLFNRLISNDRR